MSSSIRFLGLAVFAWVAVRAASLGLIPGTSALAPAARAAPLPASRFAARSEYSPAPPLPVPAFLAAQAYPGYAIPPQYGYPGYAAYQAYPQPIALPYYYPLPAGIAGPRGPVPRPAAWSEVRPAPRPLFDGWGLAASPDTPAAAAGLESRPAPLGSAIPGPAGSPPLAPKRFDRLQLSGWALLRGSPGPGALAAGGTLGGSQVGARLMYKFTPALAASLRSSSSVGGVRYAEAAAGVRWQPLAAVPVALNLERRFALNRWGGRNDFALFAEGGLYQTPIFGIADLDLYAQGGVVGLKARDLFFDGGAALTRSVWRRFSAGLGVWGGIQPGLYRVDAGPRLTMDVGRGIRVHADYRQRLAGEASPLSGPALTIAGDF